MKATNGSAVIIQDLVNGWFANKWKIEMTHWFYLDILLIQKSCNFIGLKQCNIKENLSNPYCFNVREKTPILAYFM